MKTSETKIPGVLIIEPSFQVEAKGFSMETWNERRFSTEGIETRFVQDTLEFSYQNCLTGLHYRHSVGQGKLVYVVRGEVYYAAVDIRVDSPTFGDWVGMLLSGQKMKQLYIPEGFAHGYCIVSQTAQLICRCTEPNFPDASHGIIWNDPDIGIQWPISKPILSAKDKLLPGLSEIPERKLPRYNAGTSTRASEVGC
jgi:dTDP-4-dehydrorhamnose 3,5-epimerase